MVLHRGKIATKPEILSVRPLTRDDLALVLEKRGDGDGRPLIGAVARFRDPHHRVARLFASGLRISEIIAQSGYSYQRIATLQADPAFQQLVAKYREKVDEGFVANADAFYEVATSNMLKAEVQLAEKLEAAEEEGTHLPTRDLIAISRDAADRFGYGKRQTNLNVNADFASLLEKAIVRSGKVIEGTGLPTVDRVPQSPPSPARGLPNFSEESFIPIEPLAPQSPVLVPRHAQSAQGSQDQVPFRRRA
jgi:hypothetical protein